MPKKYEAIIFDLGGVLYDIDVQRTITAFANIGLGHFENLYTLKEQTALFDSLEKGFINENEFVDAIRLASGKDLSHEDIIAAWNAILIGMPVESVQLLKDLKNKGYKLYLLSNTNIFHYNAIHSEMQTKYDLNALGDLFDDTYYSFQLGMRKPEIEIFQKVMKDHGLLPEQTVFIDDNEDNIKASVLAGVPAIHKAKQQTLIELLEAAQII